MTAKTKPAVRVACADCGGTGTVAFATETVPCPACHGTGQVMVDGVPVTASKDRD